MDQVQEEKIVDPRREGSQLKAASVCRREYTARTCRENVALKFEFRIFVCSLAIAQEEPSLQSLNSFSPTVNSIEKFPKYLPKS
jgi:hypothetical protein